MGLEITHNNPPHKLIFYEPTFCIDTNGTACKTYFIDNVILGQDIKVNACVLGFNNGPAGGANFLLIEEDNDHIKGSKFVSIVTTSKA